MLVAGLPGAGKSTLLRRVAPANGVAVVDSESQRDHLARVLPVALPYRRYRPLVHLLHRLAVLRASVTGPRVVAVHLPATGAFLRGAIAVLAALTGRVAHLVWLDADPQVALRGQAGRGRVVPTGCFTAHTRRARATVAALRAGYVPRGYARVAVLDRASAEIDPDVLARFVGASGKPAGRSRAALEVTPGK